MSDIQSVKPILSVIEDEGDFILNTNGQRAKELAKPILSALTSAARVTVISDGEVKVFKRATAAKVIAPPSPPPADLQEEFESALPGPPPAPRKRIVQDPAAPPAPETAMADQENYEAELARQLQEEAQLRQSQKFNSQDANLPTDPQPEPPKVRKRERQLAVTGSTCGRCGGGGQVVGDSGFAGVCPVCSGKGEIRAWGRGRTARGSAQ